MSETTTPTVNARTTSTNGNAVQRTGTAGTGAKKTPCPVTREEFRKNAQGLVIQIGNQPVILAPKEFSTKSLGFYANGTTVVTVNGKPCKCLINFTLTIANSKELPAS